MKIRLANKFDFPQILQLLHKFKMAAHTDMSNQFNNENHVATVYAHILAGRGLAIVADKDGVLVGMFIAMIDPIIWDPNTLIMRELAYYVDEEHRGGTAGYRLLAEYVKQADKLVEEGKISAYCMAKMENSPQLKLEKFGFRKTEEVWVAGV